MTKEEFYLKYTGSNYAKIAVHCDTEEKAKEFLEFAWSLGYPLFDGRKDTKWKKYREKTCYSLLGNETFITYSNVNYFSYEGYTIVEFELDEPNGYAIEDTPSPIKEATKEKNMKFKVGQKVRVKTDLEKNNYYGGVFFNKAMESARGNVFTIGSDSDIEENMYRLSDFVRPDYYWSAEMLEPVEEEFKVGDVVYYKDGHKAKIVDISFLIEYENSGFRTYKEKNEITKEKPLKKITKEQLKEMGYEVE